MCVILVKKSKQVLSDALLHKCWERNGHGAGFVYIPKDGDPVCEKGIMKYDELKDKTKDFREKSGTLVLHMRIQSRGGVSDKLTHPFEFSRVDDKRYLFHNGTVRILNNAHNESDSQVLADIISKMNNYDSLKVLEKLRDNTFGKFVAVIGKEYYIFGNNESEEKDVWMSNTEHERYDKKQGPIKVGDGAGKDDKWKSIYNNPANNNQKSIGYNSTDCSNKGQQVFISEKERGEVINKAIFLLATARDIGKDKIQAFCETIKSQYGFVTWGNDEVLKLKKLIDANHVNPLMTYYKQKFV